MKTYIGIDLGTTNSAICSFDGKETRVWKSPEQSDVTPSAIYIDKRGHRFYGRKAFEMAASAEKNAATLFKRYMGTGKMYHLKDSGISLTPVECSAELLRVLYGYLPEEIRKDPETVTVITVPSAFNQMKKDATQEAARLAGIGRVALMQEPVAAVMSVLKKENDEKLFLIYDLGGGTFDISVAQHIRGHVSLLAQGGREMCGGRDMDRWIYRKIILPWIREHFSIPEDPDAEEPYQDMKKAALFAAEEAKIALSSSGDEVDIWVDEDRLHTEDLQGKDIFLDLKISRSDLAELIEEMAEQTSALARETMARAGVQADQVDQIVFVGGPTMYAPLREAVCRKLGIARGTAVNPMTAVAEGAAVYAETIDWSDERHQRKESIEEVPETDRVTVRYEKRTSLTSSRIAVIFEDEDERIVRISSDETEFDSGEVRITGRGILQVPLPEPGTYVFDMEIRRSGGEEAADVRRIELTRTLASISSIPASHSIAVKALDRPGGKTVPVYLVHANDPLPKSGSVTFRAAEQLTGGSEGALTFSLWEGEIPDPVDDNRYIGTYRIPGSIFASGVIPVGAEIICDYEINEAGNLRLGVSVPCVGIHLTDQNFYSRFEGQLDLEDTSRLLGETDDLLSRTAQMKQRVVDPELDALRADLIRIRAVFLHHSDQEAVAEAEGELMNGYRRVAALHQRYANLIRSRDLDQVVKRFSLYSSLAMPDEESAFRNLEEMARYSIDMGSQDFESQLEEMSSIIGRILWRQDDVIRSSFLNIIEWRGSFADKAAFDRLKAEGLTCLENQDMGGLRRVYSQLQDMRHDREKIDLTKMFDDVSVYKG